MGRWAKRHARWTATLAALSLLPSALAPPAVAQPGSRIWVMRDTELEALIHREGEPMWRAAGLNPDDIRIVVMVNSDINAFTAGGQTIYINTGLIQAARSPNQLIGVLAHETGHITAGHVARQNMYKPALATYLLTMGLGILAAVAGAPDAGAGLIYSSDYFATLTALGYSREDEASADQAAAAFLDKAHISGRGLVEFFDDFRYQEAFSDARKYRFFLDHPLSGDRISALQARVQASPWYNRVDSAQALAEHAVMVAKLKALTLPPQQTLLDNKETDASLPARYARAIAYYQAAETAKALERTDALIADYPDNPYLYELRGQTLFEAGRPREAAESLARAVAIKPGAPLLQVMLGQELLAEVDKAKAEGAKIDGAKIDEAVAHLQASLKAEDDNPQAWLLLAQAFDAKGDAGRARLAAAEKSFHLGRLTEARAFALRARETLARDSPDFIKATDIVLASHPSPEELKAIADHGGWRLAAR